MAPLDVETVLVPVDGSEESATAVEYGVAVADRYDADLHALYVFGEGVARAIETGDLSEPEAADDSRAFLGDLEPLAAERGVTLGTSTAFGFSVRRKTRHPGSVILDAAEAIEADFIVVPRESTPDAGDVLEKAAEYVLLYASQPVLSV